MASIEFINLSRRFDSGIDAVHELNLSIGDGELMVLVGPSGCGKSTLLRMAAGLEEISSGEIRIGGRLVNQIPAQQRNVAMVFQNYALYPHMTVRRNLDFPLRMQRLSPTDIDRRVMQIAEMLDLVPLLERKPRALSGGQRQRVAMGRAIIRKADLFLMDEPLSNLDAQLRVQIRSEIIRLQRELAITTLYVTHDQAEAMTLGQRIAVLNNGRLQQVAQPHVIYQHPANTFVANFIGSPGMNLIRGSLHRSQGNTLLQLGPLHLSLPERVVARHADLNSCSGQTILAGIRPNAIRITQAQSEVGLAARVTAVESMGHETILHLATELEVAAGEISDRAVSATQPRPLIALLPGHHGFSAGETLTLSFEIDNLCLFDLHGQAID
ncbi:MAG: ABC transporter ATP-binding protein [Candidatus Thiodiazotropha sp. (ex. Lucinisca nassula)]|nr:ABC transporter ATP-binding protein [Candidatus Thiodiazotropha sp. (ex. Lucinisca nassula)]MBW9274343.1 ABC transporter ATP-binding protein [Candidatus Thiodiazotropha sp. (ex. Lucinisca nassula)]PUB81325.1 MAG: ABC transporter ATP-binding protein [gamma proteobacterium symbiont of Ctena orbiculata]PUB91216.1 MAG: ABC transporter ATP-binding protein [gamma proteobacterium symbiont of Ctena orbiculata]